MHKTNQIANVYIYIRNSSINMYKFLLYFIYIIISHKQ